MPAERVIGVDFGTSTSVIRVKRYQNSVPIGDPLFVQPVTFNMGNTTLCVRIDVLQFIQCEACRIKPIPYPLGGS